MSAKTSGRIVGSMLLIAFFVYGGGSILAASVTGAPVVLAHVVGSQHRLTAGVVLMLLNSVVVIAIGVAAYPVLKRHHPATATAYLLTRGFEAAMLAVAGVSLLTMVPLAVEFAASGERGLAVMARVTQETSLTAHWVAMIGLSFGSLLFCRALFLERLVPPAVAMWGAAGYALLGTGGVLELFGHEVGVLLGAPGGLFEATMGVLLAVKGFPEAQHQDAHPASPVVQSTRVRSSASA